MSAELDDLLRAANPCAVSGRFDAFALDERAEEELAHLHSRQHRINQGLVAAAVIAVAAVTMSLVLGKSGGSTAYAATPTPLTYVATPDTSANELLLQLASRARALPETPPGEYAYNHIRSWSLHTQVSSGRGTSRLVEDTLRTWINSEGGGRVERDGKTTDVNPGQWARMWTSGALADDPETLKTQLLSNRPADPATQPGQLFAAIRDVHREGPLSPNVRSTLLEMIARIPGVAATGDVTDRAGRTGTAFSVESAYSGLPTRYTLIFERSTGVLLSAEATLYQSAGKLNVPIPSVIGYELFLESRNAAAPN